MAKAGWARDRGSFFYLAMGCVALAAALAGFSTTYFIPLARSRFEGTAILHLHGVLFFGWTGLIVLQPFLTRGRLKLHRTIGFVAMPLAVAMAASGIGVGLYAVRRDLAAGVGEGAYSTLIGVVSAMAVFLAYFSIAVVRRNRPDWHKRMMLLATIAILWPAWFRFRHFLPWIPDPEIWLALVLADSLILVAMIRDQVRFGGVHPAYLIFGTMLLADHVVEVLLYDSPGWRAVARAMYEALA